MRRWLAASCGVLLPAPKCRIHQHLQRLCLCSFFQRVEIVLQHVAAGFDHTGDDNGRMGCVTDPAAAKFPLPHLIFGMRLLMR